MIYIDTSVLISAFREDRFTLRVLDWLAEEPSFTLSEWTVAEFSSAIANLMRQDIVTTVQRRDLDDRLDVWLRERSLCDMTSGDIRSARSLVRQSRLLRTGDALHLAIASRQGFSVATFDKIMQQEADRIGLQVVQP